MTAIDGIRKKFTALRPVLGERARRLWAGTEAETLGRGGVAWVAAATGMAISTVRKGRDEVRRGVALPAGRDRHPGGGRRRLETRDVGLVPMLESLVNPGTRGDPESPLRWTTKSLRALAHELTKANHPVGRSKVQSLLSTAGYSLQANAKTTEGVVAHPDRDAQFEHINAKAQDFLAQGLPVISVDAKKKEAVAQHANPGREWEPKGTPVKVAMHDYFDVAPKAVPYGIYDVGKNLGFVNVGTDHNTPTFAVRSIAKWWDQMGAQLYPKAREVFVTADAGGSNASKSHLWKAKLQELADRTGLTIHVSHFPPGTSKWNKVEHRLFSFITLNWRGRPLATYETIVALIAGTKTAKGLKVTAELDRETYPVGLRAKQADLQHLKLERNSFHGEWNYIIRPRTPAELDEASRPRPEHVRVTHTERRARWARLSLEQRKSGLNCKAFCVQRGIKYDTFMKMKRSVLARIGQAKPPAN